MYLVHKFAFLMLMFKGPTFNRFNTCTTWMKFYIIFALITESDVKGFVAVLEILKGCLVYMLVFQPLKSLYGVLMTKSYGK